MAEFNVHRLENSMSEAVWLTSDNPRQMYHLALARARGRKLALLAVAIVHRWRWMPTDYRIAVETVDHYAENRATREEVIGITEGLVRDASDVPSKQVLDALHLLQMAPDSVEERGRLFGIVHTACEVEARIDRLRGDSRALHRAGIAEIAQLLREIVGNPFRPATFDPAWRTSTAVTLAAQMYESRDFGAMPILADALQDAGCNSDDILDHCRDPKQTHVRGCWVVDVMLGKE
jgi:hypothetical protein